MLSAIFGIAIVALPAGIITAGYMDEINKNKDNCLSEKVNSARKLKFHTED